MRKLAAFVAIHAIVTCTVAAQARGSRAPAGKGSATASPMVRVATMSELMVHLIYPTSDAVFYITSRRPASDAEWAELQAKTLTLSESANLLMMPGRARDQGQWMKDARLMLDAGQAAFKAAKAKDVKALEALSDQMYEACTTCHGHYRAGYAQKPKGK